MALQETLKLDMTQARADIARLGKQLRDELSGAGGSFNINITGSADDELKRMAAEAKKASAEIKKISETDLEQTVAKQLKATGDAAEDAAKASDKLAEGWKRLAARAAALLGAREVFEFFRDSVEEASDTVESLNAVSKVFDESAGGINDFVAEQSTLLGFSGNAAREAAVQLGGLFQAFQFGKEQSADLSIELTKVAADLASIYNANPADAVRALSGIFRGEPEPARRFGLNITAAAVANEALRLNLIETKSQLTENTKAQATYQLILQQTQNTTGDFADTLGKSLPNQMRVLRAEFANFQSDLGEQFQKPLLDAAKSIRADLIPALQDSLEGIDFGGIASDAIPKLVSLLTTIIETLPAVIDVTLTFAETLGNVFLAASELINILPDGVAQFGAIAIAADRAEKSFGKAGSAIVLGADAFNRLTKEGKTATDVVAGFAEAAGTGFLTGGLLGAQIGTALAGGAFAYGLIRDELESTQRRQELYTDALYEADEATRTVDESVRILSAAYKNISDDADLATDSVLGTLPALEAMKAALGESSDVEVAIVADFNTLVDELDAIAELAATGTDIFTDSGDFQKLLAGVFDPLTGTTETDLEGALQLLRDIAASTDDPVIQDGIAAYLDYADAVDNNIDKLVVFGDVIDDIADSSDDSREAIEAQSRAAIAAGVAAQELSPYVLELARAYTEQGVAFANTRALEEESERVGRLAFEVEAMTNAFGDFEVATEKVLTPLQELASELDGSAVSADKLLEALDGPVKDAVADFLDDGIFGADDAVALGELIDATGFDEELRDAGIKFDQFIESTRATINEQALPLAEAFSDALGTRLDEIASQLQIDFDVIDEEDNISDVQQLIDGIDQTLADFDARRAAAAKLRLLDLESLAQEVESGRADALVDDVNDGLASDSQLAELDARIVELRNVQEAAGAEAAVVFQLGFAEALTTGNTDIMTTWIQSFELDPDALLEFGNRFIDELNATIAGDEALAEIRTAGQNFGRFFPEGLIEGIRDGTADLELAMQQLGQAGQEALLDEWGIESPSRVAREIGAFFDLGLAEGLGTGKSTEEAQKRADDIKAIFDTLADTDFTASFDTSDLDFGIDEDAFDDPSDDLAEIAENIREQTRAAVADANAELETLFKRDQAEARLEQFGGFEEFQERIRSGAADLQLDTIINAPNEALFAQIERDLERAEETLGIKDETKERVIADSKDFSLNVLEGQIEGYEEGAGAVNDTLGKIAQQQLERLRREYGIESPSKVTFEMGEQLDEGLALGFAENGYAEQALADFELAAEDLFSPSERARLIRLFTEAGEASSAGFNAGLAAGADDTPTPSTGDGPEVPLAFQADVETSQIDELRSDQFDIEVDVDLDQDPIDDLTDDEYIAHFLATVDTTQLDALEERLLELRGRLTIEDVIDESERNEDTTQGLNAFDAGGVAYRRSIFAEKRPEFAAGPHHPPAQVVGWMDELNMTQGITEVLLERYRTFEAPHVTVSASADLTGRMDEMAQTVQTVAELSAKTQPVLSRLMSNLDRAFGAGQVDDMLGELEDLNGRLAKQAWRGKK